MKISAGILSRNQVAIFHYEHEHDMIVLPSGQQLTTYSMPWKLLDGLVSQTIDIKRGLQTIGKSARPGSRIYEYCQIIRSSQGEFSKALPKNSKRIAETFLNAAREITQLHLILTTMRHALREPVVKEKVKSILSDPLLMKDQGINTPGRDAQAELYVAARCINGGLRVSFQEPDLILHSHAGDLAIAVKRVKSVNQIKRNIRNAGRQIERSGIDGLIFLELSSMYENGDGILWTTQISKIVEWNDDQFLPSWDKSVPKMKSAARSEKCLGFFTMGHLFAVPEIDKAIASRQSLPHCMLSAKEFLHTAGFNFIQISEPRYEKFRAFEKAFTYCEFAQSPGTPRRQCRQLR